MRLLPGQRGATARLLAVLAAGERIAEDCARRQSRLTGDRRLHRFLRAQARQERQHALVLDAGSRWLAPKGVAAVPGADALAGYAAALGRRLDAGDLAASLLGQQVVMEGFAEAALERLDDGIERRGGGFGRVRRTILGQERAHHELGLRRLEELAAASPDAAARLRAELPEFLALAGAMADALGDLLAPFDEAPAAYLADMRAALPGWLVEGSAT